MVPIEHEHNGSTMAAVTRTRARALLTAVAICCALAGCHGSSGDASDPHAPTRVRAAAPGPSVVPVASVPSGIPARFAPSGGWHLYVGVGEQFVLSVGANGMLDEVTYAAGGQPPFTLVGALPVHALSAGQLLVTGSGGVDDFYLTTDASGAHLYMSDHQSSRSGAVTFCAGTIQDASCGADV
jgi:hypothetical protein